MGVTIEIGTTQSVIKLMPELLDYVGTINSHRFTVQSWSIEKMIKGESLKGHMVVVKVLLKRRITQVLLSTYLPSLCILVLAQATTYFKKEHFKTSIPMAITSMLVMYTLNQSVSSKLPTTAYMKLIDVWLLFGLLLPFIIIILLILMEHLPDDSVNINVTTAAVMRKVAAEGTLEPAGKTGHHGISKSQITKFAQYILPVIEIAFVGLYALIALVVYLK